MNLTLFWTKLTRFEYWPWKYVYIPVVPYYLYLAFKNKSMVYPSHVNLDLEWGGFFKENKELMLKDIPEEYLPRGTVFKSPIHEGVLNTVNYFPVVAKPLHGQRGTNVSILETLEELVSYAQKSKESFIVQEYITYDIELAILYSRMPNSSKGLVSSITQKEYLTVTGDGESTIWELLMKMPRAQLIAEDLPKNSKVDFLIKPQKGQKICIEPIGNHCRGTIFRNVGGKLDSKKIAEVCDKILANKIGFNYGRFDLKVKSIQDLYEGKNIRVLELNGVNADPAHIFDPDYSLFKAWQDVAWHWKRLSDISLENLKTKPANHKKLIWKHLKSKIF
ncbi:MAG: hypothetical protein ACRCVT_00425 [Leadbetterella sp.]